MENRDLSQCGREAAHLGAGASIEFAIHASLHEESVDTDFFHSIPGRISTEYEDGKDSRRPVTLEEPTLEIRFASQGCGIGTNASDPHEK